MLFSKNVHLNITGMQLYFEKRFVISYKLFEVNIRKSNCKYYKEFNEMK